MASTCTFFNGYEHYKNYMCFAPLLKQNKDQYIIIEYSKLYFDKFISEEYLDDICNLFNIEYIKEKNNYKLFVSDIEGFCNRKLFFMITRFLYDMYECHKLCNPNGNYGQMDLFHKFKKETNGDLDVQPAINKDNPVPQTRNSKGVENYNGQPMCNDDYSCTENFGICSNSCKFIG